MPRSSKSRCGTVPQEEAYLRSRVVKSPQNAPDPRKGACKPAQCLEAVPAERALSTRRVLLMNGRILAAHGKVDVEYGLLPVERTHTVGHASCHAAADALVVWRQRPHRAYRGTCANCQDTSRFLIMPEPISPPLSVKMRPPYHRWGKLFSVLRHGIRGTMHFLVSITIPWNGSFIHLSLVLSAH